MPAPAWQSNVGQFALKVLPKIGRSQTPQTAHATANPQAPTMRIMGRGTSVDSNCRSAKPPSLAPDDWADLN